jgi:large subunit ribosomal protein L29
MPSRVQAKTIRDKSADEIRTRVAELKEELWTLRFRNTMKQLDNPLQIRESRREMARHLTILAQKERAAGAKPK